MGHRCRAGQGWRGLGHPSAPFSWRRDTEYIVQISGRVYGGNLVILANGVSLARGLYRDAVEVDTEVGCWWTRTWWPVTWISTPRGTSAPPAFLHSFWIQLEGIRNIAHSRTFKGCVKVTLKNMSLQRKKIFDLQPKWRNSKQEVSKTEEMHYCNIRLKPTDSQQREA